MLVLTRKKKEKITIGKNPEIVITILNIQGEKVSIGIEADRSTPVYRSELLTREHPAKKEEPQLFGNLPVENLQIDLRQEKEQKLVTSNRDETL